MRFRELVSLWFYIGAVNVLMPLGILLCVPVLLLKEKRRKTLFRRLGFQHFPVSDGGKLPIWVHALSLGETLSCVLLMEELRERVRDRPIYFSVSTLSAMQMAADRLSPFVDGFFYFPLDLWWPARRALKQVAPCLMVFIETDIWPGFQYHLRRTDTSAILVNGRLSPQSYKACNRFRSLFAPALNTFQRIHPQSRTEGQRYRDVGVVPDKLRTAGNLKFDVARRQPNSEQLHLLHEKLGLKDSDRVLLAGSTHDGEEEMILEAYETVRAQVPRVRLMIVPRHPARAGAVASLALQAGRHVQLFSALEKGGGWDVLVVDVMGVLSLLYHFTAVSFVGGSLVRKGGQNPLESAAAECPVFFGPDMSDFPDIAKWLIDGGAAEQVSDARQLAGRWVHVLSDEALQEKMRAACCRVVTENEGATAAIAEEISALVRGDGRPD